MNPQRRLIKTADIEQRLAKWEQQLKPSDEVSDEPGTDNQRDRESRAASGEVGETVGSACGRSR
jgi:hypothetical protein